MHVGELLERCCTRSEACNSDRCHGREVVTAEPELQGHPGELLARGPLSKETQSRIDQLTGTTVSSGHRVGLLANGAESYGAMFRLVEEAEQEVLVENFIFRADEIGTAFADTLRNRGAEGASVRVLHDAMGSVMTRRLPIGLRFAGAQVSVRAYNPPIPRPGFLRWGRDHRKVLIQDGKRAVVGGLCLADVWAGNCVSHCTWRDSALIVEGPAVQELRNEFGRMWKRGLSFAIGTHGIEAMPSLVSPYEPGDVPVRVVADERGRRIVEELLQIVFSSAREEILLTNPYFLPTPKLAREIVQASKRGVTVRILIPGDHEQRWVARVVERTLRPFLDAGIEVWRWSGPFIHAKTVVVDRNWCLVGSSNLDRLSLRKNSELNIEVHGTALGERMVDMFSEDCKGSSRFTADDFERCSRTKKWTGNLGRAFLPWL